MPIDYKNYPDDWKETSVFIRFTRADGQCECSGECGCHEGRCQARNGEPHPRTGSKVILTVAHLDNDTQNRSQDNLKAMCQKCHLMYDAKYHARNAATTRHKKKLASGQMEMIPRQARP